MNSKTSFADAAVRFCSWAQSSADREVRPTEAAAELAALYCAALLLPEVDPGDSDTAVERPPALGPQWGAADNYWEVFDPFVEEPPVVGSISDDVGDIYMDVKEGLLMLEAGADVREVLWHWRFTFRNHWGDHLVDGLRAIHRLLAQAP